MRFAKLCVCILLSHATFTVAAETLRVQVSQGASSTQTQLLGLSVLQKWPLDFARMNARLLQCYTHVGVSHFDDPSKVVQHQKQLEDIHFGISLRTPSTRFIFPYSQIFAEVIVSIYALSETHVGKKNVSTSIQFGEQIGFGIELGLKQNTEIGYHFIHVSNAGIKHPNPGLDFDSIFIGYRF